MLKLPLSNEEERFFLAQLQAGDHRTIQRTLQKCCELFRAGRLPTNPAKLRAACIAQAYSPDLKVRRWSLNTLVELGFGGRYDVIEAQFDKVLDDPDLMAAVTSALFAEMSETKALKVLEKNQVSIEGIQLLAAAPHSKYMSDKLRKERVPLDTATPEELRAALVLYGKGKAPSNLFTAGHANDVAVPELNLHDDAAVVKYSLWAMVEKHIDPQSMRIKLEVIDSSPPEVRKWIYALVLSDEAFLAHNIDVVEHVSRDASIEVRREAAAHLGTHVEDARKAIVKWFINEDDNEVREAILEYMSRNASREPAFEKFVEDTYLKSPFRSDLRTRLEAAAVGTPFYQQLRKIEMTQEAASLFDWPNIGGTMMTTINISGGNIGGVTGAGDVYGNTVNVISQVQDEELRKLLLRAHELISEQPESAEKTAALKQLDSAAQKPTKSKIGTMISGIGSLAKLTTATSSLVNGSGELIASLQGIDIQG